MGPSRASPAEHVSPSGPSMALPTFCCGLQALPGYLGIGYDGANHFFDSSGLLDCAAADSVLLGCLLCRFVPASSHNKTSHHHSPLEPFVAWSRAARASPRGSRTGGSVYVHETWVKVATSMSITEHPTARDRASIPFHKYSFSLCPPQRSQLWAITYLDCIVR